MSWALLPREQRLGRKLEGLPSGIFIPRGRGIGKVGRDGQRQRVKPTCEVSPSGKQSTRGGRHFWGERPTSRPSLYPGRHFPGSQLSYPQKPV
ncbi:hypothetical protein C0991_001888 [Blastosporella zonata]|nr:hypothetical protein C0991_001888 [Blastosporella zonata]